MTKYWIPALAILFVVGVSYLTRPGSHSDDLVPLTTSSETARDFYLRGRDLNDRHRYIESQKLLEEAVAIDSNFASAYLLLSRVHTNSELRIQALERAVALAPSVSGGEQLLISSAQARLNRRPIEAGEALARLVNDYPSDARAHNEYGNHLFSRQKWASAIEQFLVTIELDPKFSEAYNGLGYNYRYQGNLQASETFFLKYLELLPDDPNPYDSYADLLTDMNRHEEAVIFYQKALKIDPGFTISHIGIAANYNQLGRFSEARDQLGILLENSPTPDIRHRALTGLATSYAFEGDLEQAAREIQAACDLAKETGDLIRLADDLDNLGMIRLQAGKPDDAAKAFVQALQTSQDQPESLAEYAKQNSQVDHQQRMALVWLARGDNESASYCAQKFYDMVSTLDDPSQLQLAHQTLGMVALTAGRLDSAVEELSQSDLTHAFNQYHLALAFERVGDFTQALKYYRHASNYDRFDPLTHAFVQRRARDKVTSIAALLRVAHEPGPVRASAPTPAPVAGNPCPRR